MANSIDFTTLAVGAFIGMGCKKQLKAASRVVASTAASLAGVAASAATQVAEEASKSPEEKAAGTWLNRMDQQIAQSVGQGQAGQNGQNG